MASNGKIQSEKTDGVGILTFDNPERRNAVTVEMWQAVSDTLDGFEADPDLRVLVVRGAGGRSFVSGSDISQFDKQRANAEQQEAFSQFSKTATAKLDAFSKPVIAMIQGYCIGGGIRVAAAADIRIASEDSVFGIPAANLGLGYAFQSVERLVGIVGPAFVNEMLFTGGRFSAERALQVGLINRVTSVDELEGAVLQLAHEIARKAPLTVRAAKIAVHQAMLSSDRRNMALVDASIRACFDSQDYAIGRKAFAEKQTPQFTGG